MLKYVCRNDNIKTKSSTCPVCGERTELEKSDIYWCDNCNVPLFQSECECCSGKGTRITTDIRPVFPEERLLLEILLDKIPGTYEKDSVWNCSGNKYLINGKRIKFSVKELKNKDVDDIRSKYEEASKNISYEYELIGSNSSKATTKENYVIYNDLLPGKYTFKVRAVDSRGDISDSETMEFSIKYPFWMSPIACFIYLVIAILFIINNKYKLKYLDRLVKSRTKELEEQMIKNEELYNNNIKIEENKNKYLVNLSHELRTPLNVISSTNQLLLELSKKDAIKSDKLAYYIDISERNCNRLLNLVNNILDNTKLQSKMYTLNLKEVDIIYLVEETSLTLIDYIKSKSIELIIDPEVEEAKFTPEGGNITITIKDLDDKVMISVLDTGVGIEEKYHKTIFDRFNQVDNDESKGGSGLGLSITSKIVELHKGEIYVESKVGEGSNFVIILPVDPNKE